MSIFYSNSIKPRGFEYINHRNNAPIELQGNLKRHNSVRGFLNSEEANVSHIQRSQSRNASRNLPDSKRTLFPDYNKENSKIHSIRITHHDNNAHPGNLSNLVNRTSDDANKYTPDIRRTKVSHVSRETQQDLSVKRHLKPAPLKENQNTVNYVPTTLQGTNLSSYQDKKPVVPVQAKHRPSSNQKARYDWTSAIPTLPGALNNRDDSSSRYLSSKRAGEFSARNNSGYTSQTTTAPSTSRQYKNGESHATHDINPFAQPRKSSNMRERLLAQSTEEYFGIQGNQHKNKPLVSQNAFKSSLEFR